MILIVSKNSNNIIHFYSIIINSFWNLWKLTIKNYYNLFFSLFTECGNVYDMTHQGEISSWSPKQFLTAKFVEIRIIGLKNLFVWNFLSEIRAVHYW